MARTEYRGEFGQRWDSRLPRNVIKNYMGRQHGRPFEEIEAEILAACKRNKDMPERMYLACVRYAQSCRDADLALMREFRLL
jgi:hypothetical protein